jgi:hypothetical protein
VAAAQTGPAVAADGIDLVDENQTGSILFALYEEIPDPGSPDPDEHLDEIRAADAEERNLGFAGDSLGQQGLAGARRADQ